jgi:hypothetical protein
MPKVKAPWLVRFVVHTKDERSGRRMGVFRAAGHLRDWPSLSNEYGERLEEIRAWFNENLETPERLSLSTKPNKKAQAISWFKESAVEHITRIRVMIRMLEAHGMTGERRHSKG